MAEPRRRRWLSTMTALGVLVPVAAFVIYSSFQIGEVECEVCIAFDGREVCRTVTGASEEEALRAAIDNACALLAGGVTDTIRCSRTRPVRAECRPAGGV
ncbi:hypothetical protein L6Q96_06090 [Candidatus Binatia bacterium]|nr:hypothetical protein [Candidatus Binatia bacterium]